MTIGILKAYRFAYSITNESEGVFVSNQPLCAVSLRAALNEVLEAEARINVNVGFVVILYQVFANNLSLAATLGPVHTEVVPVTLEQVVAAIDIVVSIDE